MSSVSASAAPHLLLDPASSYVRGYRRARGFGLRCVQELARNLFRDDFLPACGVSFQHVGNVGSRRFRRSCLVFASFGYEQLSACFPQCWRRFRRGGSRVWFYFALCPRNYMGRFSSRLRGTGAIRRERWRVSVPMVMFGSLLFRRRMLRACFLTARIRI